MSCHAMSVFVWQRSSTIQSRREPHHGYDFRHYGTAVILDGEY